MTALLRPRFAGNLEHSQSELRPSRGKWGKSPEEEESFAAEPKETVL